MHCCRSWCVDCEYDRDKQHGSRLSALGSSALAANTIGTDNIAIGCRALTGNTTGISNTAVGFGALQNNLTGSFNAALGYGTGGSIITGNSNINIGFNTSSAAGVSNELRIGNGTGSGQLNSAFIHGISSNAVTASTDLVVALATSGQLGTSGTLTTYSPTIGVGSGNTFSMTTQAGAYCQIGRMIYFYAQVIWNGRNGASGRPAAKLWKKQPTCYDN